MTCCGVVKQQDEAEMMNEHIKQLMIKSGVVDVTNNPDGMWTTTQAKATEILVTLIVKECALTAAMFSLDKNDIHPDIEWDKMSQAAKTVSHTTCQQVSWKILEHFGVK